MSEDRQGLKRRLPQSELSSTRLDQCALPRELLDLWIDEQKRRSKPKTVMSFRSQVGWLKREMAIALDQPAEQLLPQTCSRFIEGRRKRGVSASTINTALRCMRAALNFGVEQRLLREGPFKVKMLRAAVRRGAGGERRPLLVDRQGGL